MRIFCPCLNFGEVDADCLDKVSRHYLLTRMVEGVSRGAQAWTRARMGVWPSGRSGNNLLDQGIAGFDPKPATAGAWKFVCWSR
jgi:hypothetical protein